MTAALARAACEGAIADTVRFHRYPACVLLGRSQDVEHAVDLDLLPARGHRDARRVTGGGAVFMSPRMLAWDVVVDRRPLAAASRLPHVAYAEVWRRAVAASASSARFRAPNDIEIGGRKVSGSSGYAEGRSAVLQGTVLIADDVPDDGQRAAHSRKRCFAK